MAVFVDFWEYFEYSVHSILAVMGYGIALAPPSMTFLAHRMPMNGIFWGEFESSNAEGSLRYLRATYLTGCSLRPMLLGKPAICAPKQWSQVPLLTWNAQCEHFIQIREVD